MLTQPFSEEERKLLNKTCEEQLKAHGRIVWAQVSAGAGLSGCCTGQAMRAASCMPTACD